MTIGAPARGLASEWPLWRRLRWRGRKLLLPYLLLAPALVLLGAFFLYPLIDVVVLSFSRVSGLGAIEQFGTLANWSTLLTDPSTWSVLEVTVLWAATTVGFTVLLAFPLALALKEPFPARWLVRGLVVLPWAVPVSVAGLVWQWIYHGQLGDLNYIAKSLGLISEYHVWLGQPRSAFISVVVVEVWAGIPFVALTILAGLQSIPRELYDAAHIDGAGAIRAFQNITLPLLKPVSGLVILVSVIWSVNSFGVLWVLTQGGPGGATTIAVVDVYLQAFQNYDLGRASTMASLLVVLLMIFSWIYMRIYRVEVN